jgi:hypothetical protein
LCVRGWSKWAHHQVQDISLPAVSCREGTYPQPSATLLSKSQATGPASENGHGESWGTVLSALFRLHSSIHESFQWQMDGGFPASQWPSHRVYPTNLSVASETPVPSLLSAAGGGARGGASGDSGATGGSETSGVKHRDTFAAKASLR